MVIKKHPIGIIGKNGPIDLLGKRKEPAPIYISNRSFVGKMGHKIKIHCYARLAKFPYSAKHYKVESIFVQGLEYKYSKTWGWCAYLPSIDSYLLDCNNTKFKHSYLANYQNAGGFS